MTRVLTIAALLASSTAQADPPFETATISTTPTPPTARSSAVWYDLGFLWVRVGDATPYAGEVVRFAPRVAIGHTFYVGGEADFGTLSGTTPASTMASRGSSTDSGTEADGTLGVAKAVAGMHAFAGPFSGAAELAAGVRHATMATSSGMQLPDVHDGAVVEAHGRLDFWLAPKISVGVVVGVDLLDSTNVSGGLLLGLHFAPYDLSR